MFRSPPEVALIYVYLVSYVTFKTISFLFNDLRTAIPGLFQRRDEVRLTPDDWRTLIEPHLAKVSQCYVLSVYHYQSLQWDFLAFKIVSPAGDRTATVYAGRGVIVDDVEIKSGVFSTPFWSCHFIPNCLDYVLVTNDSDELQTKVLNRLPVRTHLANWRYPQNTGPSVHQLCTLLNVVSAHPSNYNEDQTQCFWFARTVFTSIGRIFPNAAGSMEGQIVKERQADFNIAHVVDAVCTKYDEVYTAELPLETKKEKNKMKELLGNAKSGRLKGWKRSKYGRKK